MIHCLENVNHCAEKATPEACKCTTRKSQQQVLDRKNSTQENPTHIRREYVTLGPYKDFQDESISKERISTFNQEHLGNVQYCFISIFTIFILMPA